MSLTNAQYETIIKGYEERQTRNRHLLEERREAVYAQTPAYRELELSVGALSVSAARRLLEGDGQDRRATENLHRELSSIAERKRALLTAAGFPADYLDPIYDCPDCHDTGYLSSGEEAREDAPREKCHCFLQQEVALLYAQSNIRKMIDNENFDTLSYDYYEGDDLLRFQAAVKVCREFIARFHTEQRNLFFYGTVGTGKSFLSGCVARELLQEGLSVLYFSASGLFDSLARYSFDIKAKETLYNFRKDLYNCDLVIIDDLGTEVTNSFVTSELFGLLNERRLRGRAMIISTNLNLEELQARYSDRIFSRIRCHFTICKLSGPDIRMQKKRMAGISPRK